MNKETIIKLLKSKSYDDILLALEYLPHLTFEDLKEAYPKFPDSTTVVVVDTPDKPGQKYKKYKIGPHYVSVMYDKLHIRNYSFDEEEMPYENYNP